MSSTLIGVVLGVAATLAGIAVQLLFNARQRERDRYMQLRRDVYFEASEGLAGAVDYLFQHARTDVALGAVPAPKERPGWLYKIHLVASTDTLIAFNNAGAAAAAALLDVLAHRVAVAEVADEIAIVRMSSERIQRFQEEMRAEARGVNTTIPSERTLKRLEWIQQQIDESWKQLADEARKLEALTEENARRTRDLVRRSMQLGGNVHKAVRSALLAARAELEMAIDAPRFEAAAASMDALMTEKVNDVLKMIHDDGSERSSGTP
jgi:hypothetical protein